jgi:hypothetical protein
MTKIISILTLCTKPPLHTHTLYEWKMRKKNSLALPGVSSLPSHQALGCCEARIRLCSIEERTQTQCCHLYNGEELKTEKVL